VSGNRPSAWLVDHVLFFSYRWLAWAATAAVLIVQGRLAAFAPVLILAASFNVLATLFAQPYVRVARRNPLTLGADIVYAVLLLVFSGGWDSPFAFYAYGSLVLPGLLYGWRGRIMSGLCFMWLYPAALWAAGMPPSEFVSESQDGLLRLALQLAAPLMFALILPALLDLLRRAADARQARRPRTIVAPRLDHALGGDSPRYLPGDRALGRERPALPDDAPLAAQATKVRAAEPGVEDLRRVIFMPMPSVDMDLGAALGVLATRFDHHTRTPARVTLLGRTRMLNPIHRGLLVRLAQEALLTVQQHAHAGSASLTLRYDASSVALMIQDDGVGLLDGTYERPGLPALRAMQYRLAEFGGRLDVFVMDGCGVTVRATMPLE
jgi:hypothetical protein